MSTEKIISRGAEAVLIHQRNNIIKRRIPKSYRHPDLDKQIRTRRTRREAKILEIVSKKINSPKLIKADEKKGEIQMEFVKGHTISDVLDKFPLSKALQICHNIGSEIGLLHDQDIAHGDLTTSNMILSEVEDRSGTNLGRDKKNNLHTSQMHLNADKSKISLIDFGLGFHSERAEDKAVDLRLLRQAFNSKHFKHAEEYYKAVLEGYKITSKQHQKVFDQLKKVEARGRYKAKKMLNY